MCSVVFRKQNIEMKIRVQSYNYLEDYLDPVRANKYGNDVIHQAIEHRWAQIIIMLLPQQRNYHIKIYLTLN